MIFLFEMDFGEKKLEGSAMILVIWISAGSLSYLLIKKPMK